VSIIKIGPLILFTEVNAVCLEMRLKQINTLLFTHCCSGDKIEMRWAGHLARMGERRKQGFGGES
jgi:hypothetical protein